MALSHRHTKNYTLFKKLLGKLSNNGVFLALFICFTFLTLILETIKYPGFMGNHFYIDAKIYITVSLTLILFLDTDFKLIKMIFKLNKVLLLFLTVIYILLNFIEGAHFTNYVLNIFHLHLNGMVYLVLFSLLLHLSGKFKNEIPKSVKSLGLIYYPLVIFLIFFIVKNTSLVTNTALTRSSYILFHLNSSYDDRLAYQWGIFYKFMVFVKNNTPPDATIVIPPEQGAWLMGAGEPYFVGSFLYPRKIVPEKQLITDFKKYDSNTYFLIAWGQEECKPDGCHGWPRQEIKASKIIYKNPDSWDTIETKENIIYKLNSSPYVYGLLKL